MRGIIIGAVILACGCSALTGLDGLERATTCDGPCDEGPSDATTSDVSADSAAMSDGSTGSDGAVSDGSTGDGGKGDGGRGDGGCAAFSSAPTMVLAGGTCIDSTEVRKADYALFLAAAVKPLPPDRCAWNNTYTPTSGWPPAPGLDGTHPVTNVDWCDAYVYCAWAGKRLCTLPEWYSSCSAGGAATYPYGNGFKSGACNGGAVGNDASVFVGSFPDCVGGYPGIFDMSGNVLEWADSCADGGLPQDDTCAANGGDYTDNDVNLACNSNDPHVRDVKQRNLGFRCCATP
jgi:formylglycine-generating enzyme